MANFNFHENEEATFIEIKFRSMLLGGLIDMILDNTKLSYDKTSLILDPAEYEIMYFVKTFFSDEYETRLEQLLYEENKLKSLVKEEAVDNG